MLALTAVALVPLVAVTALAVDLAVWQGRGAVLQRAADAAALAAVPALPSIVDATERARAVAAANGIVDGVDGVGVAVEALGRGRARVTITDTSAPRAFSLPFLEAFGMGRAAVGEWAEPVSLGSPRNYLGTGTLAGNPDPHRGLPGVAATGAEGYWLATNGPCASREQGDWLTAVSEANVVSPNPPSGDRPWRGCTAAADPAVVDVRPGGPDWHLVGLRVPHGYPGGALTVQVFDAAHCVSSPVDTGQIYDGFTTTFALLAPGVLPEAGRTPTSLRSANFATGAACGEDPVLPRGYNCGSGSWLARWCNLATVTNPVPGATYHLAIGVGPVRSTARHGTNSFAVRVIRAPAATTGAFAPCSTDPHDTTAPYQPSTCIAVEGRDWLSVTTNAGGPVATFNLAELGVEHAGLPMEVALFDVGEGTSALQLLDPNGAAVGFSWRVDMAPGDALPTGGTSGVVAPGGVLDAGGGANGACSGGHLQRGPGRVSGSKYNDRMLRLTVNLPEDPVTAYGGRRWWRVRYWACGSRLPTDRTTWAVVVDGQPVRLIG